MDVTPKGDAALNAEEKPETLTELRQVGVDKAQFFWKQVFGSRAHDAADSKGRQTWLASDEEASVTRTKQRAAGYRECHVKEKVFQFWAQTDTTNIVLVDPRQSEVISLREEVMCNAI